MQDIKKLASKIFSSSSSKSESVGIYATLEELIEQRQYIKFVNYHNKRTSFSRSAGDIKSAFKGRGMEFEEIREYNYGDEVRDIDWRVTARKTTPYTKIYNEERNRDIYVFLDLSSSMIFGTKRELKSVSASKVAALLGWLSFENKDKFGCFIYDGKASYLFKPQNSRASLLAILKKISEVSKISAENRNRSLGENSFDKNLKLLHKSIKSKSEIFIISDFYTFDEKIRKSLATLAKKSKLYLIDVFDRVEKNPPLDGEYMVNDDSNNIIFNTTNHDFKDNYIDFFVHKNKIIRDFCLKFSLTYMGVSTAMPVFRQVKIN